MMVSAIPDEWQWPGSDIFSKEPFTPVKIFMPPKTDYRLRMIVQDMVAEYGAAKVALMLADIAEELICLDPA